MNGKIGKRTFLEGSVDCSRRQDTRAVVSLSGVGRGRYGDQASSRGRVRTVSFSALMSW